VLPRSAAIIVAITFIFNIPLLRTIRHQQANLWILALVVSAILAVSRRPFAAGIATGLAAHMKLYPLVFLPYFVAMRKFRTMIWSLVAITLLFILQGMATGNLRAWEEFIGFFPSFRPGTAFRDNSVHSLLFNTVQLVNGLAGFSTDAIDRLMSVLVWIVRVGVVVWFGIRYVRRERSYAIGDDRESERITSHLVDALACILLLSPMVWEHHYVLAIPFIFYTLALYGRENPWGVGLGVLLICCIPVFDLFPLSYHRLAGLLLLLRISSTPPSRAMKPIG
jgi:hypothetical protein